MIIRNEKWSHALFQRNIKHILLTHAAEITLDNLEEIIKIFHKNGYKFISTDEAISDPVYKIDIISKGRSSQGGGILFKTGLTIDNKKHKDEFKFPKLP